MVHMPNETRSMPHSTTICDPLSSDLMTMLFAKMRAIYGRKWTDQYASVKDMRLAAKEWEDALCGLSVEQMRHAINQCRDHLDWPPSIAQFLKYAKADWQHGGSAYERPKLKLVNGTWEERRASGSRFIADLKQKLKSA